MVLIIHALSGAILAAGLVVSSMTDIRRTAGFFDLRGLITGVWDSKLAVVFASAVGLNVVLHHTVIRHLKTPLRAPKFCLPTNTDIDGKLIAGSALFGAGWAVSGACPGPLLVNVALGQPSALLCAAGSAVGIELHRARGKSGWFCALLALRLLPACWLFCAQKLRRWQELRARFLQREYPSMLKFAGLNSEEQVPFVIP